MRWPQHFKRQQFTATWTQFASLFTLQFPLNIEHCQFCIHDHDKCITAECCCLLRDVFLSFFLSLLSYAMDAGYCREDYGNDCVILTDIFMRSKMEQPTATFPLHTTHSRLIVFNHEFICQLRDLRDSLNISQLNGHDTNMLTGFEVFFFIISSSFSMFCVFIWVRRASCVAFLISKKDARFDATYDVLFLYALKKPEESINICTMADLEWYSSFTSGCLRVLCFCSSIKFKYLLTHSLSNWRVNWKNNFSCNCCLSCFFSSILVLFDGAWV